MSLTSNLCPLASLLVFQTSQIQRVQIQHFLGITVIESYFSSLKRPKLKDEQFEIPNSFFRDHEKSPSVEVRKLLMLTMARHKAYNF